jgi:hypothetical protein
MSVLRRIRSVGDRTACVLQATMAAIPNLS